jgi:uncharacterized protein
MSLQQLLDCDRFVAFCQSREWCVKLVKALSILLPSDSVHGFGHAARVACLSFNIAYHEYGQVDWSVLATASLLHDVGRVVEARKGVHHARLSARIARDVVELLSIPVDLRAVEHVILEHSYSLGGRPSTPESCSLSDADKLDALGYLGFYRLAYTSAIMGRSLRETIQHYYEKLAKLPSMMCTSIARKAAQVLASELDRAIAELKQALELEQAITALTGGSLDQAS